VVEGWLRPQSVVFTLLAEHFLGTRSALFSGSFIEVLQRVGIGEHATRSTLARMTRRGLLEGHRRGRKIYLALTPRCAAILDDGRRRIWQTGAVNTDDAGLFTLLTFSIPEHQRQNRHELRARLTWAGFGPLGNGAWLAPAPVEVAPILEGFALAGHVRAFRVMSLPPTDLAALVRETFDLAAIAERYRAFTRTWEPVVGHAIADPLVLTLQLSTQWLRTIREDPRVPLRFLPRDWPAVAAQQLFRSLHGAQFPAAQALGRELFDVIEV
jgi:phenylacetic acid degradation operon negative regulatory protein